jgi:tetratricopeptide (TPR) repeat protein
MNTMKNHSETPTAAVRDDRWLEQESPEVYSMLRAVESDDAAAYDWLRARSSVLYLFTRAVAGDRMAAAAFEPGHPLDMDDLFGLIRHDDRAHWLGDRHPELHLLFDAIQGDGAALRRLKRKKASLGRLAEAVRVRYVAYEAAPTQEDAAPAPPPDGELPGAAAADVGCLIGELHLSKGDFERAAEAFSRALEGRPTADAYEGRARAYRALAELDESRALVLRRSATVPNSAD